MPGPDSVNASNNWWGSADMTLALRRIYDQRRDPSVLLLDIEPVLTESTIDCSGVANCSDRGECVGPDICRCNSGLSAKQQLYTCMLIAIVLLLSQIVIEARHG